MLKILVEQRRDEWEHVAAQMQFDGWFEEPLDDDTGHTRKRISIAGPWMKKRSKLPTPEQLLKIRLHSGAVDACKLPEIRSRMNESTVRRFDYLIDMAFRTDVSERAEEPRLVLFHEHASKLCTDGTAEIVTEEMLRKTPNSIWTEAFEVIEEAHGEERLRVIMWTKALNRAVTQRGYKAHVPLQHISHYLEDVLAQGGATRDMKLGFFQLPIPPKERWRFRFKDSNGQIMQLTKAPMGNSCIPELCHTIVSVIGGDPVYVKAQYACPRNIKVRAWIDGIKGTGPSKAVSDYIKAVDETAKTCRVTWNEKDSKEGTQYVWAGVQYNHESSTVSCKNKIISSLQRFRQLLNERVAEFTIADAEVLIGKLRHASAILGIDVARFYMFLKILRRRLSKLNKGDARRDDAINLPPSAMSNLRVWLDECYLNAPRMIRPKTEGPRFTLYTDSTLEGFGGVLINRESGEIFIVGAKWPHVANDINAAEARTVSTCLQLFRRHFLPGSRISLRIDNTSAGAAAAHKPTKSFQMNEEGRKIVEQLESINVHFQDVRYVSTYDNPADPVSRCSW